MRGSEKHMRKSAVRQLTKQKTNFITILGIVADTV